MSTVATTAVEPVKVADIEITGRNPRKLTDKDLKGSNLLDSIKNNGIIVPLMGRKNGSAKIELVAGERRFRCAKLLGLETVPMIVTKMDEKVAMKVCDLENFGREDLTLMERADLVNRYLDTYKNDIKAVASVLHTTEPIIRRYAHIKKGLHKNIVEYLTDTEGFNFSGLTLAHLSLIARLPQDVQADFDRYEIEEISQGTVDELNKWINKQFTRVLSAAPFDIEAAGCRKCKKQSGAAKQCELWADDEDKIGRCLDPQCWDKHEKVAVEKKYAELKAKNPKAIEVAMVERHSTPYTACKKSDKGAVEAIVKGGSNAGKLMWVRPRDRKSSITGKTTTVGTRSLAERRAAHTSKRWHETILRVRTYMQSKKFTRESLPKKYTTVAGCAKLVLAFGTDMNSKSYKEASAWRHLLEKLSDTALSNALFAQVKPVLIARLYHSHGVTQIPASFVKEMKQLEEVLGIPVEATFKKVCEEMPEPKSWKNLNADGTRKEVSSKKKGGDKKKQ